MDILTFAGYTIRTRLDFVSWSTRSRRFLSPQSLIVSHKRSENTSLTFVSSYSISCSTVCCHRRLVTYTLFPSKPNSHGFKQWSWKGHFRKTSFAAFTRHFKQSVRKKYATARRVESNIRYVHFHYFLHNNIISQLIARFWRILTSMSQSKKARALQHPN